jgi:hypothetical protein
LIAEASVKLVKKTIRILEVKDSAWKFGAVIPDLIINSCDYISSEYFEMKIPRHNKKWVVIEKWDLFSYSVKQDIGSVHYACMGLHTRHACSGISPAWISGRSALHGIPGITLN